MIAADPPDCVVSGHSRSGIDDVALLRAARETDPHLSFILYTGNGSEAVASEAIAAGVTSYVQKGTESEQHERLANRIVDAVQTRPEIERDDRGNELMRSTEGAGNTGGFALKIKPGELFLTEGARRILDFHGGETAGVTDTLGMTHPESRVTVCRTVARAVETGEQADGTFPITQPNGHQRAVDVTYMPATGNKDEPVLRGSLSKLPNKKSGNKSYRGKANA